jgi:hypothetical protein
MIKQLKDDYKKCFVCDKLVDVSDNKTFFALPNNQVACSEDCYTNYYPGKEKELALLHKIQITRVKGINPLFEDFLNPFTLKNKTIIETFREKYYNADRVFFQETPKHNFILLAFKATLITKTLQEVNAKFYPQTMWWVLDGEKEVGQVINAFVHISREYKFRIYSID